MSARDDLAELIGSTWDAMPSPADHVWHILAEAILAAGYRKPKIITTAEDLDALPELAAVRTRSGLVWQHTRTDEDRLVWCLPGEHFDCPSSLVPLPVWVVSDPGDDDE